MTNGDYYNRKERKGMRHIKFIILPVLFFVILAIPQASAAPNYFRQIMITNEGSATLTNASTAYIILDTTNLTAYSQNEVTIWSNATGNGSYFQIDRVNITKFGIANTDIRFRVQEAIPAGSFSESYQVRYDDPTPSAPLGNWSKVFLGGDGTFSTQGNSTGTSGWTFFGSPISGYMNIQGGILHVEGLTRGSTTGLYAGVPTDRLTSIKDFKMNYTITHHDNPGARTLSCTGISDAAAQDCDSVTNGDFIAFGTDGGATRFEVTRTIIGANITQLQTTFAFDTMNLTCAMVKYGFAYNQTCFDQNGVEYLNQINGLLNADSDDPQGTFIYPFFNFNDGFNQGQQHFSLDNFLFQTNTQNGPDANGATGPQTPTGGAPVDNPPTLVGGTTNTTRAQSQVSHNIQALDDSALDTYIFSYKSGPAASFVNDSPVSISGMSFPINVSKHSGALNKLIQWKVYVFDNMGQGAVSATFSYNTTGDGAPTLTIISPTNTTFTSTPITVNFTSSQTFTSFYFTLNGGSNTSFSNPTTISPSNGVYLFRGTANNSLGEVSSGTSLIFTVNVTATGGGGSTTGALIYNGLTRAIGTSLIIMAMILVSIAGVYGKIHPKEALVILLILVISLSLFG